MVRLGDGAGDISCVFMFFTGDFAGIGVRAAIGFGKACLAGVFESLIFGHAFAGWAPVWIGIVPAELLQRLTLGADVLVVLGVPFEVGAGPPTIA